MKPKELWPNKEDLGIGEEYNKRMHEQNEERYGSEIQKRIRDTATNGVRYRKVDENEFLRKGDPKELQDYLERLEIITGTINPIDQAQQFYEDTQKFYNKVANTSEISTEKKKSLMKKVDD